MQKIYNPYVVLEKKSFVDEIFFIRLTPSSGKLFSFSAGQYALLQNPKFLKEESHAFSITSSPKTTEHLEFCIRAFGDWTKAFAEITVGDTVLVSGPYGVFTLPEDMPQPLVFLAGGVGIAPFMSMLRYLAETSMLYPITLLYGSRTENAILYYRELQNLEQKLPHLKIIHVLSDIQPDEPWNGYRGFITREIIRREVDLSIYPTFYISGPPLFIEKILTMLQTLGVNPAHIKHELDIRAKK